ncbi:proline-rich domain-containing protein [Streptomyces sp. DT2A-34]|uniref:proline-rich domain-containing protein n=1 Tax=Streptomyces sp. DT2A-34 TaxID=3051182 RepID=UPI00265BAE7D|nr:proline-rich domain-containing protein [Streptomyces sp. DT2A-34]MDO0915821.1 proline-rich domain-containing protein [Streptomyces sp. DT2A-34]
MTNSYGSWTGGTLTARSFLKPHHVARAVFHPTWIPGSLDPSVDALKKARVIAGAVAAFGVYTFVEGGFAFDEMLDNAATACVVLLFITPLTVGVMLHIWRRSGAGTVGQLREPLVRSLKLLLLFIGSALGTVLIFRMGNALGTLGGMLFSLLGLWMGFFVIAGAYRISGNFFGTAAVHRCLPPLLATVTTWLMAISDLITGDLHGLGLAMGVVFILGAPVTVTGIALLEMGRLRSRYGIRLAAHPATLPPTPTPAPPPPSYAPNGFVPSQGNPYGPPSGNPYAPPAGNPYGTPPQGNPYAPGPQLPYNPPPPYNPR